MYLLLHKQFENIVYHYLDEDVDVMETESTLQNNLNKEGNIDSEEPDDIKVGQEESKDDKADENDDDEIKVGEEERDDLLMPMHSREDDTLFNLSR